MGKISHVLTLLRGRVVLHESGVLGKTGESLTANLLVLSC